MYNENQINDPEERILWEIAKKRASFKTHLFTYIIVNGFLWAIWAFSGSVRPGGTPWPLWSSLGWGVGIIFHYLGAYVFPKGSSVEKEFEKLKNERNR